jgi:hypothetical protein
MIAKAYSKKYQVGMLVYFVPWGSSTRIHSLSKWFTQNRRLHCVKVRRTKYKMLEQKVYVSKYKIWTFTFRFSLLVLYWSECSPNRPIWVKHTSLSDAKYTSHLWLVIFFHMPKTDLSNFEKRYSIFIFSHFKHYISLLCGKMV